MNLQLVYRYNISLPKNENLFEKKKINKKLGKQNQNDQKKKFLPRKSNPRPKRVSSTCYLLRHDN